MQRIGLHLTDRCQLDCAHCLRDPGAEPVDLAIEVIDAVLRDASQLYGIQRVSLTGGEPTLHPRFAEVLDLVVRHRMVWDAVTNGRRFAQLLELLAAVPARRAACAQVVFSLDGASDATHDAIRGPGQRREVLAAIAAAAAEGIPFAITTTLHARNAAELEAIGFEAAQLGARHVSFSMMQPTGTHLDADLRLPAASWSELYERIQRLAGILRIPVIASEGWPSEQRMRPCAAIRGETLHVDQHGRLTLCCLHADVPGDPDGETIAGEARDGLLGPHARLLEIQRRAMAARLAALTEPRDAWSPFECNACLRRFGRPHWTDRGAEGARARRERWRGAWLKPEHERARRGLPTIP